MPNNLYNQLNNGFTQQNNVLQQMMNNFGGLQQMINNFYSFKNSFQGNPQQMVQQLLQSGRMSQTEYNTFSQMASQFKNLLNKG